MHYLTIPEDLNNAKYWHHGATITGSEERKLRNPENDLPLSQFPLTGPVTERNRYSGLLYDKPGNGSPDV